jgi:hypothetical protein
MGLDLIVVAVDEQHRATDFAVHRLTDIERGRDIARFDRLDQRRPVGSGGPIDAVLDLPGGMRFAADVADEELGKIRIVLQPIRTVEFVPAFVAVAFGLEEGGGKPRGVRRSDRRDRTGKDSRPNAPRVVCREDGGEQTAE